MKGVSSRVLLMSSNNPHLFIDISRLLSPRSSSGFHLHMKGNQELKTSEESTESELKTKPCNYSSLSDVLSRNIHKKKVHCGARSSWDMWEKLEMSPSLRILKLSSERTYGSDLIKGARQRSSSSSSQCVITLPNRFCVWVLLYLVWVS